MIYQAGRSRLLAKCSVTVTARTVSLTFVQTLIQLRQTMQLIDNLLHFQTRVYAVQDGLNFRFVQLWSHKGPGLLTLLWLMLRHGLAQKRESDSDDLKLFCLLALGLDFASCFA